LGGAGPAGRVSATYADCRLTPGTRTKRSAAEE
jgi:hypothetical protein